MLCVVQMRLWLLFFWSFLYQRSFQMSFPPASWPIECAFVILVYCATNKCVLHSTCTITSLMTTNSASVVLFMFNFACTRPCMWLLFPGSFICHYDFACQGVLHRNDQPTSLGDTRLDGECCFFLFHRYCITWVSFLVVVFIGWLHSCHMNLNRYKGFTTRLWNNWFAYGLTLNKWPAAGVLVTLFMSDCSSVCNLIFINLFLHWYFDLTFCDIYCHAKIF